MILVYTAFFTPVAIYFMRSFFLAIPRDLEEAAMVDGCTPFTAFVRIVLPGAAPGLVATFVYAFLFAWDELLFVTTLTQHNAETIPIGIRTLHRQLQPEGPRSSWPPAWSSTLPVARRLLRHAALAGQGLTAGAVKG